MTTFEKIKSSTELTRFTLYKEGLFYKCYNEDAMVFVKNVREYKVSSKYVKSVGAKVYSIGFPLGEVEKGKLRFEHILEKIGAKSFSVNDENIVFLLENGNAKSAYNQWKEPLEAEKNEPIIHEPVLIYSRGNEMLSFLNLIKNYDLANSTPMQGLNFIQQLKIELNRLDKDNGNI